jgi:CHAT domain-containing protein/Flp pilus assembly protein TadD
MLNLKAFTLAVIIGVLTPIVSINILPTSTVLAQTQEEQQAEADRLLEQGIQQADTSQFREAMQSFKEALKIYQEIGDRNGEASSLGNLGLVYENLGQYQTAIEYHQQSLAIDRDIGDRNGEAASLNNLGIAYESLGQYQQAIVYYQQSLAIKQDIGNRNGEASSLNNLGLVYENLGQYQTAIEYHQQSLAIFQDMGNRQGEASSLNNLGIAYDSLGQYQQAIEYYQQSLAIKQDIGNRNGEANSLGSLGNAYRNLGQYQQAIEYYQQSLAIDLDMGNRQGEANSLGNLGLAYLYLGQYEKAIEYCQQSLAIDLDMGNRQGEAISLGNLGNAYLYLGQYEKAIEYHQQSLAIFQDMGNRQGEASSLNNLGIAYDSLGQYQQAIEYYQQSLAIKQDIGDRSGEANSLGNIGISLELQNQPELAITFLKKFVNVTELIRQDIRGLSQELQQSYTDTVADTYRGLADLLLSQGRITEAQQVLELLKVQELREFTRNSNIRESQESIALNDFEQQVIDEYGSLIDFGSQIYDCEQTQCEPEKLKKLKDQRRQLSDEFDQKIKEQIALIRDNRQADDVFYDPRFLSETAREIVEAQPGTVLIYPLVLEDKLWILWTTAGGIAGRKEIPVSRQELGNEVVKFRAFLESPNSNLQELQTTAQQLYKWLIEPIASELTKNQIQRLVFAQDRVTRYLPMAALYDGESYLIQKYTIHSILSAELTDMDDKLAPGTEVNSMLALGLSDAVSGFDPLPNVEIELDGIVVSDNNDSQGIYQGEKYLNQGFTFDILSQNVANHRILHIATHGKFEAGIPEASFLVLGTGEQLTIPEINSIGAELKDVHLVVLSACETALGGPDAEGIEIAGISSYFLQAGRASAVMASLWLVNDPATSQLMQQFYGQLSAGKTKAEALQRAQLSLLGNTKILAENSQRTGDGGFIQLDAKTGLPISNSSGDLSHPYYWAPFILIGNGL